MSRIKSSGRVTHYRNRCLCCVGQIHGKGPLPCQIARQSVHGLIRVGKGSLPCAFSIQHGKSLCRVPFDAEHGIVLSEEVRAGSTPYTLCRVPSARTHGTGRAFAVCPAIANTAHPTSLPCSLSAHARHSIHPLPCTLHYTARQSDHMVITQLAGSQARATCKLCRVP